MLKKLLLICNFIMLLCICPLTSLAAEADDSPPIMVALVQGQYAVEVETFSPLQGVAADGTETEYKRGKYFFSVQGGQLALAGERDGAPQALLGSRLRLKAQPGKQLRVNKQTYQGEVQLRVDGGRVGVDQAVPLESYVAAVLGTKSSPVWPDEAIKAQAVAVRSLALYKSRTQGHVRASDPDLFYGGFKLINKSVAKVAAQTRGEVLYYGGSIAATYLCESSGGRTESALAALGQELPYLPSVPDYDADCPQYTWDKVLTAGVLRQVLEQHGYAVGKLESIHLDPLTEPYGAGRTATGRVRELTVRGERGTATLTGAQFAELFTLPSTLFDIRPTRVLPDKISVGINDGMGMQIGSKDIPINVGEDQSPRWKQLKPGFVFLSGQPDEALRMDGRGVGRGMGLSKWGAKGLADQAPPKARDYYLEILKHYYPGTQVVHEY